MRICHLLSMEVPGPGRERAILDGALLACRDVIERTPEHEHTVLLFGPAALEARALSLGIDTTDRIACPSGDAMRAETALSRYLAHRPLFDVLTCWSERTLAMWRGAGWMSLDAIGVMLSGPAQLRRLGGTPIVTLDERDREEWAARGADVHQALCPRPSSRPERAAISGWRARLGAEEGELVVAMLADPAARCDALWACHLLVVLENAGVRAIALLPREAGRWARGRTVHRNLGLRSPLVRVDGPIHDQVAMCDLAVTLSAELGEFRGAAAVAVEQAHGAGVPVLGGRSLGSLVSLPALAEAHCVAPLDTPPIIAARASALGASRMLRRRLRTALIEHEPAPMPSLADTLSSIWAHAPARRRPMVAGA